MNQYVNEVIRGCLQGQLLSDFCEEWMCFTEEQITAIFFTAKSHSSIVNQQFTMSRCKEEQTGILFEEKSQGEIKGKGVRGAVSKINMGS